jgi:hypothetical protein
MSKKYLRAYSDIRADLQASEPGTPIRFTASTEGIKRDGKDLSAADWHLDNFKRNPVFLWVHDYWGERPPIGKVTDIDVAGQNMDVDVVFDQQDDFARSVESKYRRGFLNAVSVGWDDLQVGEDVKNDLLDISGVPVPGDPDALMERQYRALQQLYGGGGDDTVPLGAVAPHSTALAPLDHEWQAHSIISQDGEALRKLGAWSGQTDLVEINLLLHHLQSGEAVWRGVAAAMLRLFGAAAQIPDADREAVYNHLRRHYQQFKKEPPEYRTAEELGKLTPALVRGMFLEGETDLYPWLLLDRALTRQELAALQQAIEILKDISENVVPHEPETDPDNQDDDEPDAEAVAGLEKINTQLEKIGVENEDD